MNEDELKAFEALKEQIEGFKSELKEAKDQEGLTALTEKITNLESSIEELKEKDVDKEILEINKELLKYREQIVELREKQNEEDESGGKKKGEFVSAKEIQGFIDATFDGSKKTREHAHITVKAPEIFGIPQTFVDGSDMSAFTGRFIDPELYQRRRKRNLILDNFPISSINVPELLYLEKIEIGAGEAPDDGAGGADWITSGGEKPMRSFRVTTGKVEAKKVAIFGTIEDKLLRDVPSFDAWIREDFRQEMRETYNDGLLNNNPAVNEDAPLGLKQNAITFAATPAFDETVVAANYIDGIVAASAYLDSLKEEAGKAFVAGDVWYAILILKDTTERYQNNKLIYTNSIGQLFIGGVEIVKSDAEDIPSTHLLLTGIDVGFKIRNYGDAVIERGLNEADFRHDRTSYRGYQEVLSYIPSHRVDSVLYDTWANILTAIEVPEA